VPREAFFACLTTRRARLGSASLPPAGVRCGRGVPRKSSFFHRLGGSSNGRTPDSGSGYQGSNPCPPARRAHQTARFLLRLHGPHRLAVRTPASHVGNTGSIPVGVAPARAPKTVLSPSQRSLGSLDFASLRPAREQFPLGSPLLEHRRRCSRQANGHWGRWTPLRSVQLAGNSRWVVVLSRTWLIDSVLRPFSDCWTPRKRGIRREVRG
jgi:hypothetical protein